jgi:hypothetical protein
MTDEQINAAIADVISPRLVLGKCEFYKSGEGWVVDCPNYCTDLNAMHEAEKMLDYQQAQDFGDVMYNLCADENSEQENPFPWRFAVIHGTARQRAKAFLRTLGKWDATTEDSSADESIR